MEYPGILILMIIGAFFFTVRGLRGVWGLHSNQTAQVQLLREVRDILKKIETGLGNINFDDPDTDTSKH